MSLAVDNVAEQPKLSSPQQEQETESATNSNEQDSTHQNQWENGNKPTRLFSKPPSRPPPPTPPLRAAAKFASSSPSQVIKSEQDVQQFVVGLIDKSSLGMIDPQSNSGDSSNTPSDQAPKRRITLGTSSPRDSSSDKPTGETYTQPILPSSPSPSPSLTSPTISTASLPSSPPSPSPGKDKDRLSRASSPFRVRKGGSHIGLSKGGSVGFASSLKFQLSRVNSQSLINQTEASPLKILETKPENRLVLDVEIQRLSHLPENSVCADCSYPGPRSVHLMFGVFICNLCASVHRHLFPQALPNVQSLDISYEWTPQQIKFFEALGNSRVNQKIEHVASPLKPSPDSSREQRSKWADMKYVSQSFAKIETFTVFVGTSTSKRRKFTGETSLIRFQDDRIFFYSPDQPGQPETLTESYVVGECTLKQEEESVNQSAGSGKDNNPKIKFWAQLIHPTKTILLATTGEVDLLDIMLSLTLAQVRNQSLNQGDNPFEKLPEKGLGGASAHLSLSRMNSSPEVLGTSAKQKLQTPALKKTFSKFTTLLQTQRQNLRQQLSEAIARDLPNEESKSLVSSHLNEIQKLISDAEAKKQEYEYKLNRLEPDMLIQKVAMALSVDDKDEKERNILHNDDGSVKGGSLKQLVCELTSYEKSDPDFMIVFMITFRSFTSPQGLLDKLILRFQIEHPPFLAQEDIERFVTQRQIPIRLRVTNVLKHWLSIHSYDFEFDLPLSLNLLEFIDDIIHPAMPKSAEQLRTLMENQILRSADMKAKEIHLDSQRTPISKVPNDLNNFTLMDIDPEELARQICLVEQELFRAIKPRECLNQAWSHKLYKETSAPNILAMIRRFNRVSDWTTTQILSHDSLETRVEVLKQFVNVAMHCRMLHNYNATMEILSGLSASPVHRLKRTWRILDIKTKEKLELLKKEISSDNNSASIRHLLHTENPPSIPYLGIYLTDLTFIEDGNPDKLPGGLINFSKRKRIAGVIREIMQYQQTPYNLASVPEILDHIRGVSGQTEDYNYSRSLYLEPKESS